MDNKRLRRHKRVRAKIKGTAKVPRLCVFRSNKHIYGQLIDDEKGKILLSAKDLEIKKVVKDKIVIAKEVGKLLAEKAITKKYKKVVFDRAGYKYHGRVKALAEGAREGGLKF
jgi:large subunit ribosomal protein L18